MLKHSRLLFGSGLPGGDPPGLSLPAPPVRNSLDGPIFAIGKDDRHDGLAQSPHDPEPEALARPRIWLSSERGVVVVHEPRLFRDGTATFCRGLVELALGKDDVLCSDVDLAAQTWRIQFDPARVGRQAMAEVIASSIHEAIPAYLTGKGEPCRAEERVDRWSGFRSAGRITIWESTSQGRGRLRIHSPSLRGDPISAFQISRILAVMPGITSSKADLWSGSVLIEHDASLLDGWDISLAAEFALHYLREDAVRAMKACSRMAGFGGSPPRSLWCATLAAGCLGLTLAGILLPGLPTIPFLAASLYFLVRCSPRVTGMLCRLPVAGYLFRKAASDESVAIDERIVLKALATVCVVGGLILFLNPPLPIVLALELSLLGLFESETILGFFEPAGELTAVIRSRLPVS